MDQDCMQSIIRCVTFMHSYSADPCSETNKEGNRTPSDVTCLENADSICSVQSKGLVKDNSASETCPLISKRHNFRSPTSSDFTPDKLVCKTPPENGKPPEEGICDENSQKENRANNISGHSKFSIEDYGVPKCEISCKKSSPINGHPENSDLLKPVPKRFSNTLDAQNKKKTKYEVNLAGKYGEKLSIKSEKLDVGDSNGLFSADDALKFLCDVCGKGFKKKKYLQKHSVSHNIHAVNPVSDRPINESSGADVPKLKPQFFCTVCGSGFARSSNLRRHQTLHKKVSPKLKGASPQKKILLKTMRNRHMGSGKSNQHRCLTCGHFFRKKIDLLLHQITHAPKKEVGLSKKSKKGKTVPLTLQPDSGEETDSATEEHGGVNHHYTPYVTDDASTDTADEFEDNSSPVKFFSCNQCDLKFLFQKSYVTHMESHPELEEFECALCHVRFDCTSGLADHFASQCGEKRFRCDVCEQRFARRATLMQHIQTHTKQVAHKCHLCRRPYNYLKYLKNHYVNHHRVEPHQCATCGKLFHTQSRLESHSVLHNHPHVKEEEYLSTLHIKKLKYECSDSEADPCFADSEENFPVPPKKKEKKTHRKKVSFLAEPQIRESVFQSELSPNVDFDERNNNHLKSPSASQKSNHRRKSLFLEPNHHSIDDPAENQPSEPPSSETAFQPQSETPVDNMDIESGFHSEDLSAQPMDSASRLEWLIYSLRQRLNIPEEPELEIAEAPEASDPTENSEDSSYYFIGADPDASNFGSVDSPMDILAQAIETHLDESRDLDARDHNPQSQTPDLELLIHTLEANMDEPNHQEWEDERNLVPAGEEPPPPSESPSLDSLIPQDPETPSDPEVSHSEAEEIEEANPINSKNRLDMLIQTLSMRLNQTQTGF